MQPFGQHPSVNLSLPNWCTPSLLSFVVEHMKSVGLTADDCHRTLQMCHRMGDCYDDELQRNVVFLEELNALLEAVGGDGMMKLTRMEVEGAKGKHAKGGSLPCTDGHNLCSFTAFDGDTYEYPTYLLQVKAELGVGNAEPIFEALANVTGIVKATES
jgi:hypothetical protein